MEEKKDIVTHYPTQLPAEFTVGSSRTHPVVTVSELQAHLRLLGAFHKLKVDVESQEEGIAATNKDLAWVVFVNKAVVSFFDWTFSKWNSTKLPLESTIMPPLPVMMVWHTYLLNPRHYYEDSQRISSYYSENLTTLEEFPLELAASLIDDETLEAYSPSEERRKTFEDRTYSAYDIHLVTHADEGLSLPCPFCDHLNPLVTWIADGDRGFAQPKFEHKCEGCNQTFNKGNIGVGRFVEEFMMKKEGTPVYFPETYLRAREGTVDTQAADARYSKLFKQLDTQWTEMSLRTPLEKMEQKRQIANTLQWDPEVLCDVMHTSAQPRIPLNKNARVKLLHRIANAYSHAGYASLDLVAAMLRQGTFIDKMVHMGWTRPGRWEHADTLAPLVRSVARYHAFLDLTYVNGWSLLVPTLDIDLSWHTHQLKGRSYREDTLRILGRILNHDDSIDAGVISSRYDQTAKLWRERFGVPYSVCGCAPDTIQPPRATKSSSPVIPRSTARPKRRVAIVSKVATLLLGKSKPVHGPDIESATSTIVVPETSWQNPRPDLVSMESEDSEATHPSEHDILFGRPESFEPHARQSLRQRKVEEFVNHAQTYGHDDPFRVLQVERNRKKEEDDAHEEAFTDFTHGSAKYYAFWGVSMAIPLGFYGGHGFGLPGACGTSCAACGNCASGDAGGAGDGGGDGGGGGCSGGCGGGCGGCG